MATDTYVENVVQYNHSNDTDTLYGVVRNASKQIRDVVNSNFEACPGSGSFDDYDISTGAASGGLWSGSFPEIASGFYIYQVRLREGDTPDFADEFLGAAKGYWDGAVFAVNRLAILDKAAKMLLNKAVQNKVTGAIQYYDDDGQTVILTHTPQDGESQITRAPG